MGSAKTKKQTSSSKGSKQASVGGQKQQSSVAGEIKLLVSIGVFLLLFLGNFGWAGSGDTGINWISNRLKGVFGITEYLLPVYFILSALYCYFNKDNKRLRIQIVMAGLIGICLCIFFSLIHGSNHMELKIGEYFADGMETLFSGGLIGGLLATLLYRVFGMIGAFVLLFLLVIIFVVLMTEKSFVAQVQKAQKKGSDAYQQSRAQRVEQREVRRQQQEYQQQSQTTKRQQPQERKSANGMSVITLQKENKRPKKTVKLEEEMHEVFAQPAEESFGGNMIYDENSVATPNTFTIERNGKVKEFSYEQEEMSFEEKIMTVEPEIEEPVMHMEEKQQAKKRKNTQKTETQEPVWSLELEINQDNVDKVVYQKPSLELLQKGKGSAQTSDSELAKTGMKLQQTLQSFGVNVSVTNVSCGPSVTRYELLPEQGVKVSRIVNLADDIKLNLAVSDIRIEAPIPGKAAVGIEVPNTETSAVLLRDLIETKQFTDFASPLTFAVGKDISGQVIVADIAKMPHLLIAGATGSGKSVCINTLIMSLLYKANPKDVKLIMIDPKVVELSVYNGIPHMMIPVVTDPKKAAGALNWAVLEMTERYIKFADFNVRDLKGYNEKVDAIPDTEEEKPERLPQIVIIVDELADLMMVSKNEVEDSICRLAQKARAAGIHLILATQRPSVDVITGLIKANMPSRIAFAVSSGVDSRTIIDINGAEKLLGKGDMLFYPSGYPKPVRVQGAFVSDKEVSDVVKFLSEQNKEVVYNKDIEEKMKHAMTATVDSGNSGGSEYDDYFVQAGKFVIEKGKASTSMIQRVFKVGFNRAARIMDQLEEAGVVSAEDGTKPRHILMSENEFEQFVEESV